MEVGAFRKVKRSGYSGVHNAYILSEDAFGLWAWTPVGTVIRWTENGEERLVPLPHSPGYLRLIPRHTWWIASWWPDGNVFIDTVTPVDQANGTWSWVDLVLDVRRTPDGAVFLEDEDEFEDACTAGHINEAERRAAEAAGAQLVDWLTTRTPPFDDTGWQRFEEAASLTLPALDAPKA